MKMSFSHQLQSVPDLKQIGKGEIPPSMESVNCDGTTNFKTGEKLVIRGKVSLKEITSLTSKLSNLISCRRIKSSVIVILFLR